MSMKTMIYARQLRKRMTVAEKNLWLMLRQRRLRGYHFRKQAPLGQYIVDFICHEAKIIIEIDGGQHNEDRVIIEDQKRTRWLNEQGYIVQRFWNNEIIGQLDAVLNVILELCNKRCPPILSFPHKKRGEGTI